MLFLFGVGVGREEQNIYLFQGLSVQEILHSEKLDAVRKLKPHLKTNHFMSAGTRQVTGRKAEISAAFLCHLPSYSGLGFALK